VDTASGRATAFPAAVAAEVARRLEPAPADAGRRISL
jgi:hypothetical protein